MSGIAAQAVMELHNALAADNSDATVVKRPLRPVDPNFSIGVWATGWDPLTNSMEIGRYGPTLARYGLTIQTLVKSAAEEGGLAQNAEVSKSVREMVYRDADLRLRLRELSDTLNGSIERVTRVGVTNQQFLSNELGGSFIYVTTTKLWVETETT